jgi:hypothetical protein
LKTVQRLFEENITGGILRHAKESIADANLLINEIQPLLATCKNPKI